MKSLAHLTFGIHVLCRKCKGSGRLPVRIQSRNGKWRTEHVPCLRCKTAGYMFLIDGQEYPDPLRESFIDS